MASGTMPGLTFVKMSGAGNDFILVDNRAVALDDDRMRTLAVKLCARRLSVGADGIIFIATASGGADFRWRFFNADGSEGEMCGNGARCAARFARLEGIAGETMAFDTLAGRIHARVAGERVRIRMTPPDGLRQDIALDLADGPRTVAFINTGVPHVVVPVSDPACIDMPALGREIRHHPVFAPDGTNVNAVALDKDGSIALRTFERGVEDETLACGTGAVAAALVMADARGVPSPVRLRTRSGRVLEVGFERRGGRFDNVFLEGDARRIYTARLDADALEH